MNPRFRYILSDTWPAFLAGIPTSGVAIGAAPFVDVAWPLLALAAIMMAAVAVAVHHAWATGHRITDGWLLNMERVIWRGGTEIASAATMREFVLREADRFQHVTDLREHLLQGISVEVKPDTIATELGKAHSAHYPGARHIKIHDKYLENVGTFGHEIRLACCHVIRGSRPEIDDMQWMTDQKIYDYSSHPRINP